MALTKHVSQDKIEIVGEFKHIQVRTCTKVLEDGVELSSGYHRHVVSAGDDYSNESAEVQAICAAVHTDAVVEAKAAHDAAALEQGEQPMTKARENSDYTGLAADIVAGDTAARAGRKNLILNGGFDVWQRGTSFSGYNFYTSDRWKCSVGAVPTTFTVDKEVQTDGTVAALVVNNSTSICDYHQRIERGANITSGKSITASFDIWGDATDLILKIGTGTSANNVTTQTISVPTTRTRQSVNVTVPTYTSSIDSMLRLSFSFNNKNCTVRIANVQLELGSVATDFEHRSYGEELALCQRYYQINNNGMGRFNSSGNNWAGSLGIKSPMRATPSLTLLNATNAIDELYVSRRSIDSSPSTFSLYDVVTGTGGTYNGGQFVVSAVGGSSGIGTLQAGFISLDAEL